jgi:hypothetical protein
MCLVLNYCSAKRTWCSCITLRRLILYNMKILEACQGIFWVNSRVGRLVGPSDSVILVMRFNIMLRKCERQVGAFKR